MPQESLRDLQRSFSFLAWISVLESLYRARIFVLGITAGLRRVSLFRGVGGGDLNCIERRHLRYGTLYLRWVRSEGGVLFMQCD